jgi:hypothetical protein
MGTISNAFVCCLLAPTISSGRAADAPSDRFIVSTINDGRIDASRIKPYDNAFVVTQLYPDGRINYPGIWTDQVRLREVDGRKLLVRTQSLGYYDGRILSSVNAFDPHTFAPISDIQRNPDGSMEKWAFAGGHVEGHLSASAAAKEEIKTYDFPAPFYDFNCCMRSLAMSMIEKSPGLTVTIPAFDGVDTLSQVTFKVLRREKVHAGAQGLVDAWLIETPLPGGYIHFWLTDKPPYMVRMTLSANTVNAYAQSFDIIGSEGVITSPPEIENAFGHGEPSPPK